MNGSAFIPPKYTKKSGINRHKSKDISYLNKNKLIMNTVYFQPPGIKPEFCEVGMISETDKDYIWYLNEPCKILISEVKIIDKENVIYDKKSGICRVLQAP